MLSYLTATAFFLALICLTAWIISNLSGAAFPTDSIDISHLAKVKILSGMASFAGCFAALFIAFAVIVTYTPFLDQRISRYNELILQIALCAALLAPLVYFAAQNRLLARWLPTLLCPYCAQETVLIKDWSCPGDCAPTERHALAPCRTCNTKLQGILCEHCDRQIIFMASYTEREVISRGKRHITEWNRYFMLAIIGLYVGVLGIYGCWQAGETTWLYIFAGLAAAGLITLVFQKPKTLVKNQSYGKESVEEWLRKQRR
jgi:hypothetical protein